MKRSPWNLGLAALTGLLAALAGPAQAFSLSDRVACQREVERVLWQHRGQAGQRLAFEQALPERLIRRRAEDVERQSQALAQWWRTPITAAQLQAELDRMAASSKDPAMLRELFAALGNDPLRAAECLARPALADRLWRAQYARDERIHGERRRQVLAEHAAGRADTAERQTHVAVRERAALAAAGPGARLLAPDVFEQQAKALRRAATTPAGSLALGQPVRLREDLDRWTAVRVDAVDGPVLRSRTTVWRKTPIETWWAQARGQYAAGLALPEARYSLPAVATVCRDDSWQPTASLPDGRYEHTAVWTGSEMIVWGGMEAVGNYRIDGARYRPATDTWQPMADSPVTRTAMSSAWTGKEMLVWGGRADGVGSLYDPGTDTWRQTSAVNAPVEGASWAATVWTGQELIVWGGMGGMTGNALAAGARYNPKTDTWVRLPASPLTARAYVPAVWTGQEMVIWSGYNVGIGQLYGDGARYNPSTNQWTGMATANAPDATYWNTSVWTGQEMLVWGGVMGGADVRAYNPATNSWRIGSGTGMPSWRYMHGAVWTGTEMMVHGGWPSNGASGLYNPVTDSWRTASSVGMQPGTQAGTLVWTGTEALAWGGLDDNFGFRADGGRYDPATDTWRPMTTNNVPSMRGLHSAEWTGAEMVVWGGYDGMGVTDTGGRYSPATDSWLPTSTVGAATARNNATAVWTGQEIIFWGAGSSAPFTPDTGGIYNPATDSWRKISSKKAPWVTYGHTAVWTGSEMITYGGVSSSEGPAIYNLATDTWRAGTLRKDPGHRDHHGAVWSGSEMIVWGGSIDAGSTPTGGRYNPVSNSWTPLPVSGSPDARMWPVAVWTGTEAIFWGGYDQLFGVDYNDGARFSPATGQWTRTSLNGAPTPRVGQGVYSGSEMVVWGGTLDGSGGRYDPSTNSWRATTLLHAPDGRPAGGRWSTVFTGDRMIVWGGYPPTRKGAGYCLSGAANQAPVGTDDRYRAKAGKSLLVTLDKGVLRNDLDANGDRLTARVVSAPAGQLGFNANGSFRYTPPPGFIGTDQFEYVANDDLADSAAVKVKIQVK
ncbi:Kelch repeat-containing protein [Ideonella alba]|uniref:Cadherin-like domain-containing protein n=1 Tax=Ideonella alba TaxID=2824118 RepID=A0A940YAZ8_9BURK|nr:Ig-like domain-containing protein [Ideonella alba]MBQ0928985.1 cadherin-like domain-containing protein [Ideonella alba]